MRPTNHGKSFQNRIVSGSALSQNLLRRIPLQVRDGKQQVLGGDVFVFEVGSLLERLLEQFIDFIRKRGLRRLAGHFRKLFQLVVDVAQHGLRADPDFFEHRRNNAFLVFKQRGEQVKRPQLRIAVLGGEFVRPLDGFLRFDGKFVPTDWHREPRFGNCEI